jgi:hypothetical protein
MFVLLHYVCSSVFLGTGLCYVLNSLRHLFLTEETFMSGKNAAKATTFVALYLIDFNFCRYFAFSFFFVGWDLRPR